MEHIATIHDGMLLTGHGYRLTYDAVFYQLIAVAQYYKFQVEIGTATNRDFYIEIAHTSVKH